MMVIIIRFINTFTPLGEEGGDGAKKSFREGTPSRPRLLPYV